MAGTTPQSNSPKLFFDISGVVDYIENIDRYSGIQRVVATLISEFSELVEPERLYLSWCDKAGGEHLCVHFSQLGRAAFVSPKTMRCYFHPKKKIHGDLPALRKYRRAPLKFYFHRTRLDVASIVGSDKSFLRYNMTAQTWKSKRWGAADVKTETLESTPLQDEAAADDLLILLDFAGQPRHIELFQAAKGKGLVIHSLIYDLIPIAAPHLVPENAPLRFYDWMLKTMHLSDRFMAISEAARLDTLRFFETHKHDAGVTTVPLAQASIPDSSLAPEIDEDGPLSRNIKTAAYPALKDIAQTGTHIRQLLAGPFVLCVGTIEARKNSWRIAMAWKQLLDDGHRNLPKLVFAGRIGAVQEDFADLLAATGNLYGYVRILEGPSDMELDLLYKHCSFTIMASLYEGWGLPVGEALAYGKTAVVANNSSLPEVGGDMVEYCDAEDISSIADAVKRLTDPAHRTKFENKISTTKLRGWDDVAKDLAKALQT